MTRSKSSTVVLMSEADERATSAATNLSTPPNAATQASTMAMICCSSLTSTRQAAAPQPTWWPRSAVSPMSALIAHGGFSSASRRQPPDRFAPALVMTRPCWPVPMVQPAAANVLASDAPEHDKPKSWHIIESRIAYTPRSRAGSMSRSPA